MKNISVSSLIFISLVSSNLFAGRPGFVPDVEIAVGSPNSITCESETKDLKVSIFGFEKPTFMILSQPLEKGGSFDTELANPYYTNTGLGQIIAGFDPSIADATITYNLIVPNVLVELGTEAPVEFKTVLVESFSGGFFFGPAPAGVHKNNKFVNMSCTAQFVYVK